MSGDRLGAFDPEASDEQLADAVMKSLGTVLPEACLPGVVANVRLLEQHYATLQGPAHD